MDHKKFKELLTLAGLNKKGLSKKTNLTYGTVNNWGSSQNIPHWVESWLENYIKARYFERIVEAIETIKKDIPD